MHSFTLEGVGEIEIKKSARAKRVILSIRHDGTPRITIPRHVPYGYGRLYATKNKQWLMDHIKRSPETIIKAGARIGQNHTVEFKRGKKLSSRVGKYSIVVTVPAPLAVESTEVQAEALKACTRAMRRQAEAYLPSRMYEIAQERGYTYRDVRCKALKTRWGSCSSNGIINLNIWLMQLSDELIDYVISHELTHLHHQHHQPDFWLELETMIPNYKQLRKELKTHRPYLNLEA